ncbi:ABC transporter ATP-binding protein [Oligoflexus tunisiensis]|uniref:ABC transporter ATP-binding protein n=1 Tax=Oligoflexus tunisiensis TaxID=708132 RepID=UPI00114D1EA6|nr:ABC transporter ATP-binding protein [Oligoflexus tunisiensis]
MHEARLLEIRNLSVAFADAEQDILCLDRISLDIRAGEILGLVGESGCGKSTLCRAILRSLRAPAYIAGGRIFWKGRDLFQLDEEGLNKVRWREIALVVQSSLDALNPVMPVERQLVDAMRVHTDWTRTQELTRCHELLDWVGLPRRVLKSYPFEMSGGMRQRVVIAMALALEPQLLMMDEPTTALDVVTQAEILGRLRDLQEKQGFSVILVTHDLPLALDFCDSIAVMSGGRIVEMETAGELAENPLHPYTVRLLQAFPRPDAERLSENPLR